MHKRILENDEKIYTEVKILDFEYSGINFRGFDLASYIIETTIDYHPSPGESENPNWVYRDEMFPSFDVNKEGTINIDYMIETYLTEFYANIDKVIPNYM